MNRVRATLAGLFLLVAAPLASAQTRLFSDSSDIAITLQGPLSTIQRLAARGTDPRPGTVVLAGPPDQTFNVQIRPRGITRRAGGICTFTPLRIDFDPHAVHGTLFQGQRRLKLVAPCRTGDSYQQLVVLEYIAYRLYNVMTPVSFRVRPVRVTYHDTDGRADATRWGYFIEDQDDVAHRNHRVALNVRPHAITVDQLDPELTTRNALFQYMISNLDWDMLSNRADLECCHNDKLFAANTTARTAIVPVPYDFDYSGLVNAPYAIQPEGIRVNSVRQRYFRGYCRFNNQLPAVIADVRARRAAFFELIDNEARLDRGHRETAHNYLADFFATLDDPQKVAHELTNHCRGG